MWRPVHPSLAKALAASHPADPVRMGERYVLISRHARVLHAAEGRAAVAPALQGHRRHRQRAGAVDRPGAGARRVPAGDGPTGVAHLGRPPGHADGGTIGGRVRQPVPDAGPRPRGLPGSPARGAPAARRPRRRLRSPITDDKRRPPSLRRAVRRPRRRPSWRAPTRCGWTTA